MAANAPPGRFRFDPVEWRLYRDGQPVVVQDKALALIAALLERPGRLWTREELYARLWPGVFVSDDALFQAVRKARQALDDDPRSPRWIETVQGRGYRLIGAIPAGPLAAAVAEPPAPPPAQVGSALVGREALLASLRAELQAAGGLWTLTGPGGVGKTSLARALIAENERSLPGTFCDAADVGGSEALLAAVGRALGLDRGADLPAALSHALEGLGPALLVLDNLEQVAAEAAPLVARWRAAAPELRLVLTSRIRLGLGDERLVDVPPLGLPDPGCADLEGLRASSAGLLLLRRAARLADLPFAEADAPVLVELIHALGGLPLAIELATPRLRLLSPAELLSRMARQLDLLRGTAPDRPARHAALRSTIATSWALLRPWQQAVLSQLAQFAGPFSVEAAEAALDLDPWPEAVFALDVLGELVDHSLVRRREPGSAPGQPALLELLPSIRAFVREVSSPERALAAQARIDRWYAAPERARGPGDPAARAQRERASLVAGLERALEAGDVALAPGLARNLSLTLLAHGPLAEATARLAAVAAMPGLPGADLGGLLLLQAEARLHAGDLGAVPALLDEAGRWLGADGAARAELAWLRCEHLFRAGQVGRAHDLAAEALSDTTLDALSRARLLAVQGYAADAAGRPREGHALLCEALALLTPMGDHSLRVRLLLEIGWAAFNQGNMGEALAAWDRASASCEASGDRLGQARVLERRGQALSRMGCLDEAEAALTAAVGLFQRGGFLLPEGGCLNQLATIAMHQGKLDLSERRFRAAISLFEAGRLWMAAAVSRGNFGILYARQGRLDEARSELRLACEQMEGLGASAAVIRLNLGKIELYRGDTVAALALVSASLAENEAVGRAPAAAHARATLGQIAQIQGDDQAATPHLERAVVELRAVEDSGYGLGSALGMLGLSLSRLGRSVESESAFDESEAVLVRARLPEPLATARARRGRAALARGDRALATALREGCEAEYLRLGLTDGSELGQELVPLRRELERSPS